ncbi:TonB-dependent receptor plug domain-containing protein [Hymenobacter cellulosilyticus]|uniref:TonB-dependent receptor plug domain-containing protein n=1 Tax=Hymenobacter cellulosilyticus TaxID=2932248 RepID=A0A8T9Q936_9BACT|nr:TonB-dependent receptor plug domain-containing protein [Hymenobacter cellulosilyticus]
MANVTSSSQPLYVVDGIPVYNMDAKPENWTGLYRFINETQYAPVKEPVPFSPMGNPLLDLPVADIDQVEVLKGAAATAQYGIQGTNGVIRISTRRGADGLALAQPLRVRYAGWGGLQQVRQRYDLLDARQYAELANEAARNDGNSPPYSAAELNNLSGVDWQDKAFRVAGMQSHNLSVDGLTAHGTRYYVAADYLRQGGVLINSQLSRYSLRANVEQQLGRKLTVSAKVAGSQLDQKQPGFQSDASSTLATLLQARPILPPPSTNPYYTFNPMRDLEEVYFQPRTRRLLAQLRLSYQVTPALSLRAYASREQAKLAGNFHVKPTTVPDGTVIGYEQSADSETKTAVYGSELSYQQTLGDRHGLSASLHYQQQQYERSQNQERRTTYAYLNNPASIGTAYIRTEMETEPLRNATAAVAYVYDKRYELRASMRSDFILATDDSKEIHRWFPGAELRWHLGQEAFLADVASLSALSLQAGAGRTRSFYSFDQTDQVDAGLHLGMLHDKLTLDAQVYRRRTEDAQATLTTVFFGTNGPITSYYSPQIELRNQGVELTLGGSWQLGQFRGLSTVAVAANKNEVTEIRFGTYSIDKVNELEKGQSVSRFFVFEQQGTYPASSPEAGRVRFRDRNNNGQFDYGDGQYQGSGLPRRTLNLYQQLHWQRWQLEAQLDGLFGYQILNTTLVGLDRPTGNSNASVRALDYWTPNNQNTSVPKPGRAASYGPFSDQDLASGNHVRLSQLMLSYEVLNTEARRLSVWVGGQNLFVTGSYRGFDPNVSSGGASPLLAGQDASVYPVARVWQLGVRGQF